ncbi:uncharacterized protein LOC122267131 [Penaeus japonicus]|uniref:uncharacterized protein LOC122267131 n=1 Tax=Penaeus japonicus TaxID=27405 RepID=UPI001C70BB3E|nr:uncharacterized protein LOC122267131 [Penaeus japonicus]
MPASLNQGQSPCLSPREKTSRQHSQPETRAQDPKEENLEDQPTLVDEKSGAKPKIRLEGKNEQATFMAKDLVPNPEPVTTNFFVELEGVEEIIENGGGGRRRRWPSRMIYIEKKRAGNILNLKPELKILRRKTWKTSQPSWTRNQGPSPRFGACPCLSPREKTSRQHSQPETRAQDPKEENLEDQPTLVDEKSGAKPKIRLEGKNEQATFMAKDLVPNPEPVTTNFFVELEGVEEIIETEEAEEGDAFQNDYIIPRRITSKGMPASLNQGQSPCLSPKEKTSRQHSQPETRAQDPKEENLEDQPTLMDEKSGAKPKIRRLPMSEPEGKNEQATFST